MIFTFENTKINFCVFLFIRIVVGMFVIRTVHKSDEYFQGPQVAHHMVYGYGELAWEWTFEDPIRNPIFPMVYAVGFYIIKLLNLSQYNTLFSLSSKLTQSLIAASFDTVLIEINKLFNGQFNYRGNQLLVLFNFTSWVSITYLSRTYVNSLQTLITTLAFYFWLLHRNQTKEEYIKIGETLEQYEFQKNHQKQENKNNYDIISRCLVVLGFMIRGTSIMYWMTVWPYQLIKYHSETKQEATKFIIKNIITIVIMVVLSIFVSVLWYQKLVWVEYNFFYYNVIKGWSSLCGTSPFYQYFIIYQYKIFSFGLPFLFYGVYSLFTLSQSMKQRLNKAKWKQLFLITLLTTIFLSFSSHKQLRFMLILYPALILLFIRGLKLFPFKRIKILLLIVYFMINIYFVVSRNMIIKSGSIPIVNYIRDHSEVKQVLLHLQTYDLPMYSHIHKNISLIVPEASFVNSIENKSEMDFAKLNPQGHLQKVAKSLGHYPQYMVTISSYLEMKRDQGGLVLDNKWEKIMDEWYPSPMQQHYFRRIYLYKYLQG